MVGVGSYCFFFVVCVCRGYRIRGWFLLFSYVSL